MQITKLQPFCDIKEQIFHIYLHGAYNFIGEHKNLDHVVPLRKNF